MTVFRTETRTSQPYIGMRDTVADPGLLFDRAISVVIDGAFASGLRPTGPVLGIYFEIDDDGYDMAVAVPVESAPDSVPDGLMVGELPDGDVAVADHIGPYDELSLAWSLLREALDEAGHTPRAATWEEYRIGPDEQSDPTQWRTRLRVPI